MEQASLWSTYPIFKRENMAAPVILQLNNLPSHQPFSYQCFILIFELCCIWLVFSGWGILGAYVALLWLVWILFLSYHNVAGSWCTGLDPDVLRERGPGSQVIVWSTLGAIGPDVPVRASEPQSGFEKTAIPSQTRFFHTSQIQDKGQTQERIRPICW